MCAVIETDAAMTGTLTLGYREATAMTDSILTTAGTVVRGHEFHRTACSPETGSPAAWRWSGAAGADRVEGFARGRIHASYLHLHWAGHPRSATGVVRAAQERVRQGRAQTPRAQTPRTQTPRTVPTPSAGINS
jgi:cobyrinic acid a,c-diamide synthase